MNKLYILIIILAIALATRLTYLELRPMDHDESVHAWFAYRQVIESPTYKYDPAFHGPFLYFAISLSFLAFGDSDFSARLPVALFSILGIFFALKFERWLGRSAYILAIFMLISPSILYYSRYARDDVIGVSSFIAVIYLYLSYRKTQNSYYAIATAIFLAVIFTAKENWVQYFGVFFLAIIVDRLIRKDFNLDFRALIPSIAVFALFSSFLYSSAFAYAINGKNWLEVMFSNEWVDRFFERSLPYWLSQGVSSPHDKPIHYFFNILLRYEFLTFALALASIPTIAKRIRSLSLIEIFAICWVIIAFVFYNSMSYKTSWLVIHLATPLAFLSAVFMGKEVFENRNFKLTYLVGLFATLLVSFHVTYIDFNNVDQPLIYVQTQWGAVEMSDRIRELLGEGYRVAVFAVDGHYWPLPWILRHEVDQYSNKLLFMNSCPQGYDYVFVVYRDYKCLEGYEIVGKYELRKWWEFYEMKKL
ncbi:MAG: TIGR03663 family protein [Archaeoglobaceae archaeon]|nr:TIGR03663 family protein [Archaeoglobaceae archaeon]MDW8118470.1 TIGR03663 family protein [Archaeoglobaceae archaeon]